MAEVKQKHYLVCPKCGNQRLIKSSEKRSLTEDKINEIKEYNKHLTKRYLIYGERLYYNDPEYGYAHTPEPGAGWRVSGEIGSFLCVCGYYSPNYKDFIKNIIT